MRFVADCMLGKLAKWLRILGFDVLYFSKVQDDELLNIARREKRTLLTRDTRLQKRAKSLSGLLVESETWNKQVVQVLTAYDLKEEVKPHSRCLECNRPLKRLTPRKTKNLVTPFVFERARGFAICPECGRVYWKGTHFDDMESKVAEILAALKRKQAVK